MAEATPPTSPAPVVPAPILVAGIRQPGQSATSDLGAGDVVVGTNPGDLQTAINAALNANGTHKGQTLVCAAGTVYTQLVMPQASGAGWTRIKTNGGGLPARGTTATPSDAAQMFTVQGLATPVEIPVGSNGWHFIGINAFATQTATGNGQGPFRIWGDRVIVERSYIHADPACMDTARGILVGGSDIQVWDSTVKDIFRGLPTGGGANTGESIGIYFNSLPGSARVHIEHNEIQASGQNIMFNDQGSAAPAQDVTIQRNHLYKDKAAWQTFLNDNPATPNPSWDGKSRTIKNLLEVKWAKRVLILGNILEGSWAQVGAGGVSLGQNGIAILVNSGGPDLAGGAAATDPFYRSNDIRIESNTVIDASHFFEVQTVQNIGPMERVAVLNNLGIRVPGHACFGNWAGLDIWFEHNTVVPMDGAVGSTAGGPQSVSWQVGTAAFPRNTIRRNVLGKSTYGLYCFNNPPNNGAVTDAIADFITTSNRDYRENAIYGGLDLPCTGFTAYANAAAVGVSTSTDPLVGGRLTAGSPVRVANGGGGTDGQDLGTDFTALANAQAGVAPPPAIPVANFTYTQTVGTFTIQFTDLSSNTPTSWAYSGPEGFSSTSQNPSFTFPTPGTKSITLVASNAKGSSAPYTAQITVATLPGFTHVQTTIGPHGTALRVQAPSLTVGNLLMVHGVSATGDTAVAFTGMTDAAGNTYTPVNAGGTLVGAQNWVSRSFYTVVTAGSGSAVVINAQMTGTNPQTRLIASEYLPNLGAITFIGSTPMQSGGGASPMDSGALATPATGGALLLGFTDYDAAVVATPAGWTNRGPSNTVAEKTDPAVSTTYHFQPTYTGTQNWVAQMAIFASGSGGPPPDTTAPTVPTGLAHALPVATDLVSLTWTPSFDAVGVANYDVRRDGVVVGTVTSPAFIDTGLQSNTAYSYTVRANDAVPNSSAYSAAHVVTTAIIETGTFLPPRFMRGFGPVRGSGATDAIQTPALGHGAQRTITGVLRIDSAGAAQVLFTKSSTAIQSLTERLRAPGNGTLVFERQWSNALGAWSVPLPSLGVRHFFVIRMDTSLPANKPTIKIDNLAQVLTTITQPTNGAAMQNTPGYMLGNQPGGAAVLNGDLGRFAVFNFITTDAQDASLFAANDPAGIGVGAVQYVQLDGSTNEPDEITAVQSVLTGTVTQDYDPPSFVTVKSAGRTLSGWVR